MNVLLQSLLVRVSQQCAVPRLNRLSEIGSCGWARHLFIFHCLPSFSFTLSRAAHVLWFDTGSIRSLIVLFISYIRALYCTSACLHHDANNSNKKTTFILLHNELPVARQPQATFTVRMSTWHTD